MNSLIDVVIVTYKSATVITKCLDCLNSERISTIVLVDNASDDGIEDIAQRSASASKIKLIQSSTNLGFAKAVSLGVSKCQAQYILILNPDCEVTDDFLESVIVSHRGGADVVVPQHTFNDEGESLPGLVENPATARIALQVFLYQSRKKIPKIFYGMLDALTLLTPLLERISRYREKKNNMSWYWPNGACFSITKRMYELAGRLPEHYFMYNEDVEFGYHLKQKNCRFAVTKETLFHAFRKGSAISVDSRMELILRAHLIYLKRAKNRFL